MTKLPCDWIDKIFLLLEQFYGERWRKQFSSQAVIDIYKMMWKNGLNGLSYEQLKHGLAISKRYSWYACNKPPTVVKFYYFCIGLKPQ